MRILVAEDEKDLNRIITKKLTAEGYSVDSCYDGEEALHVLSYTEYDIILLDIMMPKVDGLQVLRALRDKGNLTPVLFLTARDSIDDRVLGLDSGANDYMVKPFSFKELSARLRALTRSQHQMTSNNLQVADLILNRETQEVTRGGKAIDLSAKEYAMLEYLMQNQGAVLSREKIENHVWNFDYEGGTNVVDVYISYLRKKIDEGQEQKLIQTVRGRGYVLKEGD